MRHHRTSISSLLLAGAAAAALTLTLGAAPAAADRGGRGGGGHGGGFHGGGFHGGRSTIIVGSPFYSPFGWDWFYGYGWGYPGFGYGYGPYAFRPEGGLNPAVARAQGLGGFDLNVKPRNAEVWVDGRYVGEARDFDGYPSFLWLKDGDHTIAISKGGYQTWEREVSVEAGRVADMKLHLDIGTSLPPQTD